MFCPPPPSPGTIYIKSIANKRRRQPLYLGIAAHQTDKTTIEIGICIHDGVYSIDFCVHTIQLKSNEPIAKVLKDDALETIQRYSHEHHAKFIGCGITDSLAELCPDMCSFLWSELDIVVMKFKVKSKVPKFAFPNSPNDSTTAGTMVRDVDEQADSAARKCIMHFGPAHNPALSIGFRNRVEPDIGGKAELVSSLESYRKTVHEGTWNSVMKYANELKKNNTKIAFFSATPQGGGVALMRHAMIRFFGLLGVNAQWFVSPLSMSELLKVSDIPPKKKQVHPEAEPEGFQNHKDKPQHPARRR